MFLLKNGSTKIFLESSTDTSWNKGFSTSKIKTKRDTTSVDSAFISLRNSNQCSPTFKPLYTSHLLNPLLLVTMDKCLCFNLGQCLHCVLGFILLPVWGGCLSRAVSSLLNHQIFLLYFITLICIEYYILFLINTP